MIFGHINSFEMVVSEISFYRPKRSFGQGNVFTSVCHEFCSQGGGIFWGGDIFSGGYFFGGGEIRSTFGRYASYWNAFLLKKMFFYTDQSE